MYWLLGSHPLKHHLTSSFAPVIIKPATRGRCLTICQYSVILGCLHRWPIHQIFRWVWPGLVASVCALWPSSPLWHPTNYNDKHSVENKFSKECLASLLSLSVILKAFVPHLSSWPILTDIYALSASHCLCLNYKDVTERLWSAVICTHCAADKKTHTAHTHPRSPRPFSSLDKWPTLAACTVQLSLSALFRVSSPEM